MLTLVVVIHFGFQVLERMSDSCVAAGFGRSVRRCFSFRIDATNCVEGALIVECRLVEEVGFYEFWFTA